MKRIILSLFVCLVALSAYAQDNLSFFEQEFEPYLYGRMNNDAGVGTKWYRRFSVFHITDVHGNCPLLTEAVKTAQGRADIIVNTGDDANGCETKDAPQNRIVHQRIARTVTEANTGKVRYVNVPGNHDVPGLTKEDYFDCMARLDETFCPGIVWGDAGGKRNFGYYDVESASMGTFRFILLDPFDYPDGQFETRKFMTATFSQSQVDWLIRTLKDAASKGLHVITLMHYSFGDNSLDFSEQRAKPDARFYQDAFMIPDIIDAAQNGTRLTAEYPDALGVNNIRIDADFSGGSRLDYICHLFGHIHSKNNYWCQKTDGSKVYDILMLGEANLSISGTALCKIHVTPNSPHQIAFSALMIDTVEKAIYRVSYGAYLNYDKSNSSRTGKFPYRR